MGEVMVQALRGVDLDLYAGEYVVLLGASGSGKSTLLNILGGQDVPSGGTVHYHEHDLSAADDAARTRFRRQHVGFVFQFYNLIPSLTALENVSLVTEIARNPMRPEAALALVGLEGRMHHFPSQLSEGEQQRVAIARALITALGIPLGYALGHTICAYLSQRLATELYTLPLVITPRTYAMAALAVGLAALLSGALVARRLRRLALIAVLKTRE